MKEKTISISFIRHAPTESNKSGIFMGSLDVPCDESVLIKNQDSLSKLSRHFDIIYSSPLSRANVTAKFIFPNREINLDSRLMEKDMGDWKGQSKDDLKILHPNAFLESGHIDPLFIPSNGESNDSLVKRVLEFLTDIILSDSNIKSNKRIAIVTHNGVIRVGKHIIEKMPVREIFSFSEPFLTPITYKFLYNEWKGILK